MRDSKGTMNIELIGHDFKELPNRTSIKRGVLKLPEGLEMSRHGKMLYVGENDQYLHTFNTETGDYIGIFKSDDMNHIYQRILELNDIK